ncbi:coiled-coil domain-containing protein 194 isoform X2 [Varanus komodoensis]|uniref:coiled-coil domain-containing protein 194 isoform X2 n=1 Tax=Varanus komodoensis TaxID=61221 RepID=UPI001CF784F2|nr:coiled-coil domain-containing protein 194 isoform X2 [Varanus komodoensis]
MQTLLAATLSSLHGEISTLVAEGAQMETRNGVLLAEVAQWQQKVAVLEEGLREATEARGAAEAEKEHCDARQNVLQESLHGYLAEIASLQRRLQARSSSSTRRRKG